VPEDVDPEGHLIGIDLDRFQHVGVAGEKIRQGEGGGGRLAVTDDDLRRRFEFAGDLLVEVKEFRIHVEHLARAVLDDVKDIAGGEANVEGDRHRTDAQRAQIGSSQFRRIVHQDEDAVALADAVAAQRVAVAVGRGVEFAVAHRAFPAQHRGLFAKTLRKGVADDFVGGIHALLRLQLFRHRACSESR